mgnify:CR=1 FL=1
MKLRTYTDQDAEQIAFLLRESVTELAGAFYTAEQVAVWAKSLPNAERIRKINETDRSTYVASDANNAIQGFIDLEPDGHIDYLYVSPSMAGKGLASKLYDLVEMHASELGVDRLYTEASEHACRFFRKKNFVLVERRDFEIDGVSIHNFSMKKSL